MAKPLVSIIITTRNSAGTLTELLESIRKQSYANTEIIVVDNKSTDATRDVARRYTKLIFDKGPERSAQRNFGAQQARGKYLLILDSDMVLTKNVIKYCVELIEKDPDVKQIVIPEKSYGIGFWAKAKALEREINKGEFYFEAARFFPKQTFWEFGGYDEELTGPEDWDLSQRIGYVHKTGRIKSYIKHNEGKPTLLGFARRKYYYGISVHKYLQKQGKSAVSPTTIYFLRPAFYKNWRKIITNPFISLGMIVMLTFETIGGGLGFLVGRARKGK